VPLDPPGAPEASHRWVSRLAAGRDVLDADRELDDLAGPLPYESSSFDLVISLEALESVDDHERGLAELCRVLRPHGMLVVSLRGSPDLGSSLRRRFEHVCAYRQEEWSGSLVVNEDTVAVASNGSLPELPGLALVGPESLDELRDEAARWRERALYAEAEAAAKLTEMSQAQRGEERALMSLRAAQERRREAVRALERRPLRRLRRILSRGRGTS
jgi:SAM-dependent methyltransferase